MPEFEQHLVTVSGTVENIVFRNEKNGYTVCEMRGEKEEFVAVGIFPYVQMGEHLELSGHYVIHPDYGPQFQALTFERKAFTGAEAIERYLCSGLLKGIGPKLAKRIVSRFGLETLDVMKKDPQKLAEIKGVRMEKAMEYASVLLQKENFQDLTLFLAPFHIGQSVCIQIEKQLGENALTKIKENPYCLLQTGLGIGFQKADRIAIASGWDPSSPVRIRSAMTTVLLLGLHNGHTCLPLDTFLGETSRLVMQDIRETAPDFESMLADERIVFLREDKLVAWLVAYQTEKSVAKAILSRLREPKSVSCSPALQKSVRELCADQPVLFDETQIESICLCLSNPLTIITGGPGTGKTTLVSLLCKYMERHSKKVALAAPTGRAAKRMQEATKHEAKTIHRLLELQYQPDVDDYNLVFARNQDHPIDADLVIVDETSMLDIFLLNHLICAIPPDCALVFIGDENQLPAVGAGNVLKDMIASRQVPYVELKKVYRQGAGSLIVRNSYSILQGSFPEFDQTIESEFMLISKAGDLEKAQSAVSLCKNILTRQYHMDPIRDVQILTPTRRGACGSKELNRILQEALNPEGESVFSLKQNDKVMQIKNNYEIPWTLRGNPLADGRGVFNGDLGTVVSADAEQGRVTVLFDEERIVEYDRENIEELELAYAITVHKSQGSEYETAILILPEAPQILMTRNLLYTAVSRAKNRLFVITEKQILQKMIANTSITKRCTLLERFLSEGAHVH